MSKYTQFFVRSLCPSVVNFFLAHGDRRSSTDSFCDIQMTYKKKFLFCCWLRRQLYCQKVIRNLYHGNWILNRQSLTDYHYFRNSKIAKFLNVVRFNKTSQFSHACKLCLIYSVITKDFRKPSY